MVELAMDARVRPSELPEVAAGGRVVVVDGEAGSEVRVGKGVGVYGGGSAGGSAVVRARVDRALAASTEMRVLAVRKRRKVESGNAGNNDEVVVRYVLYARWYFCVDQHTHNSLFFFFFLVHDNSPFT